MTDSEKEVNGWIDDFITNQYSHFAIGESTDCNTCVTGDKVISLGWCVHGYIIPDGCSMYSYHAPYEAYAAFKLAFDMYTKARGGPLYWRQEPELEELKQDGYVVRARLFCVD